ncbi:MAG: hypothetical protein KTR31_08970 [Myxococcales bacterium]|nr:hypothetical protein [Myxococcales bacterium]
MRTFCTSCLSAVLASGCQPTCDATVQTDDPTLSDVLATTLADFAAAIAPAEVCLSRVSTGAVRKIGGEAAGRYNPVSRGIRVEPTDPGIAEETLRHELCHGWHTQVLGGLPAADLFRITSPFQPYSQLTDADRWSERKHTREAFAFTCQLDPVVSLGFASDECGSDPAGETLRYLRDEVYVSVDAPTLRVQPVLDIPLNVDSAVRGLSSVSEFAPGHLDIWFDHDGASVLARYLDLATGVLHETTGHTRDLPRLDSPRPASPAWVSDVLVRVGGRHGDTEVAVWTLSTPRGHTSHTFARLDPHAPWQPVRGACALSDDPVGSLFFLGSSGTALWSISLQQGRLVVFDWSALR